MRDFGMRVPHKTEARIGMYRFKIRRDMAQITNVSAQFANTYNTGGMPRKCIARPALAKVVAKGEWVQ